MLYMLPNSPAIPLPVVFDGTGQEIDLQHISNVWRPLSGSGRDFSLFSGKKLPADQSGKSKNLHQPFGLMSPCTTSQDRGGRNKVQAAQVRPLLGRS
jgi:hypothetical protein